MIHKCEYNNKNVVLDSYDDLLYIELSLNFIYKS